MDLKKVIADKKFVPSLIISGGLLIFLLLKTTAPSSPAQPPLERSWTVDTIRAQPQALSPTTNLYGQVETPDLLNAAAPASSRVTQVKVREGDKISTGERLLTLDSRDFNPRLLQANAQVTELEALISSERLRHDTDKRAITQEQSILNLQQSAVRRAQQLKNKKLGSEASLEEAEQALNRQRLTFDNRQLAIMDHQARLQQLESRLKNAQAAVELAALNLERSQVIAPFDGYIETVPVSVGDHVNDGQILMTLYPSASLELRAKIPAFLQGEIQQALHHGIQLIGTARYAGQTLTLQLSRLSGKADNRGIDALFTIKSGNQWVRPGVSLSVQLARPLRTNLIALPASALYENSRVFRVIDDRLQSVSVDIIGDYQQGDDTLLLIQNDTINAGDQILTTQLPNAISGLKVTPR